MEYIFEWQNSTAAQKGLFEACFLVCILHVYLMALLVKCALSALEHLQMRMSICMGPIPQGKPSSRQLHINNACFHIGTPRCSVQEWFGNDLS